MTEDQLSETLARLMLSDKRPYSTYHDAAICWELIEFMLNCLKECHWQLDEIVTVAKGACARVRYKEMPDSGRR